MHIPGLSDLVQMVKDMDVPQMMKNTEEAMTLAKDSLKVQDRIADTLDKILDELESQGRGGCDCRSTYG